MYDLIGDIHGYADALRRLLESLGYQSRRGVYAHPERRVIFLGDFIDRGPQIGQVLEIVRPMVEERSALAVLGNHEWNALAFHTVDRQASPNADPSEQFLRHQSLRNIRQHRATLQQLSAESLRFYLDWFRTLPMWLDLEGLRVVHACWDEASMRTIAPDLAKQGQITDSFLHLAGRESAELFQPVEVVLKGKEAQLPRGLGIRDQDGQSRTHIRLRWYASPVGHSYRTYAFSDQISCDEPLSDAVHQSAAPYPADAKPVFFGHYWLTDRVPRLLAPNVACLDYSVAKGGLLCAYRWDGEATLDAHRFVWTPAGETPHGTTG